jgi:C1A family cysteine protease
METPRRKFHSGISRIPPKDLVFKKFRSVHNSQLPMEVDLRPKMPPVYDQGELGSCTANALVAGFQYADPDFMGSRLFLYYNERLIENSIKEDSGAQLFDGIASLQQFGVCLEASWPYEISQFDKCPSDVCYQEAEKHKALSVENIYPDLNSMKNSLFQGFPFVVGIEIFQEFESQQVAITGRVPMPTQESVSLGGHAVLVVGYTPDSWIVRNSWGPRWGDKGYFYLPYAYLLNPVWSSDFWSITKVDE